ncbi:MAG: RND transporter, partial [Phycisphaerae bacterium]
MIPQPSSPFHRLTLTRAFSITIAAGTLVSLSGCKVGPNYAGPPALDTPATFAAIPATKPS